MIELEEENRRLRFVEADLNTARNKNTFQSKTMLSQGRRIQAAEQENEQLNIRIKEIGNVMASHDLDHLWDEIP